MAVARRRSWFQFRLCTALLLMLAIGAAMLMNSSRRLIYEDRNAQYFVYSYGWPYEALIYYNFSSREDHYELVSVPHRLWYPNAILYDSAIAAAGIICMGLLSEVLVRRYRITRISSSHASVRQS